MHLLHKNVHDLISSAVLKTSEKAACKSRLNTLLLTSCFGIHWFSLTTVFPDTFLISQCGVFGAKSMNLLKFNDGKFLFIVGINKMRTAT